MRASTLAEYSAGTIDTTASVGPTYSEDPEKNMARYKVALAAGGTGGHVYPAIAVADAMQGVADVVFVGGDRLEAAAVPAAGYDLEQIRAVRRPPGFLGVVGFLRDFSLAALEARRVLREHRPDVVVGFGSYISAPTVLVARLRGTPTLVHEQNVQLGATNRVMCRLGATVLASFPETEKSLRRSRIVVTGCPVRSGIGSISRPDARAALGVPSEAVVCLVVGGSLGAVALNEAAHRLVEHDSLVPERLIVHICGEKYYESATAWRNELAESRQDDYILLPYTDEMHLYLAAADVIISRSGSSTVNEILCAGRAAILIPSPNVTEDHQMKNAIVVQEAGGALVISEDEIGERLVSEAELLLGSSSRRRSMEAASRDAALGGDALHRLRDVLLRRLGASSDTGAGS